MIITTETTQDPNPDLKTPASPLASPISTDTDIEPPPQYSPGRPSLAKRPTGSLKPINYASVYRRIGSLEGEYVIDPTMQIPSALLPALGSGETEETRKHLRLETKTGSIHADVTLVDRPTKALVHKSGRVTMEAKAGASGSIVMKIHASDSPTRLRFHLGAYARGSTTLHLPHSFRGNLTISVPIGHIKISEKLSENLSTISETSHTRRCFVGEISELRSMESVEMDEVCVEVKLGNVTLLYDDDPDSVQSQVEIVNTRTSSGSGGEVGGFVKIRAGILGRLFT